MKKEYTGFYNQITSGLRKTKYGVRILNLVNQFLTLFMYILYPLMLIILFSGELRNSGNPAGAIHYTLPYVLIPGISFVVLTILRDWMNWKRPYEEHDIRPLIEKDTKGHSMPSRHVFSCTVIAMCVLSRSIPLGAVCMLFSCILCFVRVLGGVHYPRDVVAGFIIGLVAGALLFIII